MPIRLNLLACLSLAGMLACGPAVAQATNTARAHVQAFLEAHRARLGLPAPQAVPAEVAPQVIGGGTAPAGSFPAVVALLFAPESNNAQAFYCGGTLVGSRHVLTAAHCADFLSASQIEVLVGSQSLASGGTRIALSAVAVHPNWDPDTVVNDVAVLTLAQPVSGIKPVLIAATETAEDRFAAVGAPARIAGWGQTALSGTDIFPTELQQAGMTIQVQACSGTAVICATSPRHAQATCFGDSGGPLFSETLVRGRRVQVGVTSFGIGSCGDPNFPDFFARMATLGAWVKQQIAR
jgi:secreted trypsin-like serine protease